MEELTVTSKPTQTGTDKKSPEQFDKNFKPKGAIAFFILLVALGLFIWFSIYYLMLDRI
jgi:hypothetical protein